MSTELKSPYKWPRECLGATEVDAFPQTGRVVFFPEKGDEGY
jgi:hypothetical protein